MELWWILLLFPDFIIGNISWKMTKNPAIFGQDMQLNCTLPKESNCCNTYTRRWLGGKHMNLLTMNGVSVNRTKYSEMFDANARLSILIVHLLDIADVDVPYECTYGFQADIHMLNLTVGSFEAHPKEPLDDYISTSVTNVVYFNVTLENVFPKPNCSATVLGSYFTEQWNIITTLQKRFYSVVIQLEYQMPQCHVVPKVVCHIGTKLLEITKNRPCTDKVKGGVPLMKLIKEGLAIVGLCIAAVIVVGVFLISYALKTKRMKSREKDSSTGTEMVQDKKETEKVELLK